MIKLAGEKAVVTHILAEIQPAFGDMKVSQYEFINCGVRRVQRRTMLSMTLNQIHFALTLKTTAHPQMSTGNPKDKADAEPNEFFRLLLGALVYLAHTRVDILVFICAFQRRVADQTLDDAS